MDIVSSAWYSPVLGIPLPSDWKNIKGSRKKIAKLRNKEVWDNLFFHYMTIAADRYYIDGLPDTCEQRVSIMSLLWYGRSVFFEQDGSIYNLPCVNASDGFTKYGEWRKCRWMALNGESEEVNLIIPGATDFLQETVIGGKALDNQRGVLIRENYAMFPFIRFVIQWTDYVADTLRALDTARRHLKHPTIIAMPQEMVNKTKEMEDEIDDNVDVIGVTQMHDSSQIAALNMGYQGISDELRSVFDWYDAQFMGLCGIAHNSGVDKKGENMIQAEVGVDSESDNTNLMRIHDSVQAGLDLANETWGLHMQWKSRHLEAMDDAKKLTGEEENSDVEDPDKDSE